MRLLIEWPHSLYGEGYCAVIVSHDGDMARLLEQAVYAVARHSDSELKPLLDARGRMPQPPYPVVVAGDGAGECYPLDSFALYKDGAELPRTGTLAEAGITDRDWLTLDYVVRDRFGKGKPASETSTQGPRVFDYPLGPGPQLPPQQVALGGPTTEMIRILIREEIEAHERKQWERAQRVRQPGENI